jgi:transcriptional regulator with XRE-family HTH domain
MTPEKIIASNIILARKEKGLTRAQLADKVGIFRQSIERIEKGEHSFKINTLIKISKALDISIYDLLKNV